MKSKQEFFDKYPFYGYPLHRKNMETKNKVDCFVDRLRKEEFPNLKDHIYLDHAGTTLYSKSQMTDAFNDFQRQHYGNPHSHGAFSELTQQQIEETKNLVFNFLNTSSQKYSLIFTSNATGSLKLIGESFPWTSYSTFHVSSDSHNSVIGLRSYALSNESCFNIFSFNDSNENVYDFLSLDHPYSPTTSNDTIYDLIAFPAECNFSGYKHSLSWIQKFHEAEKKFENKKYLVLLDASKFLSTSTLHLDEYSPDFIVFSFYKLFGYPTGLGALLIKNDIAPLLNKKYFGGGTVQAALLSKNICIPRNDISQSFTDGTENFLSIISIKHGLKRLNDLGMNNITMHVSSLIDFLYQELSSKTHYNGQPLCKIYGTQFHNSKHEQFNSILSFNLKQPDGSFIGYAEVERLAILHNIQFRTGCFCNPGACQTFLELLDEDILNNISVGHVCWDDMDIINGKVTGAIRVSLGYMSTFEDIHVFLQFIYDHFLINQFPPKTKLQSTNLHISKSLPVLRCINIFPIKSCRAFSVKKWPIGSKGLLYDREWAIVNASGKALRLKTHVKLGYIQSEIDLDKEVLKIQYLGPGSMKNSSIKIQLKHLNTSITKFLMCGQKCQGYAENQSIAEWLSQCLDVKCWLIRYPKDENESRYASAGINKKEVKTNIISYANEAQFLLLSTSSINNLNKILSAQGKETVIIDNFRGNFIIDNCYPHQEDEWEEIEIGNHPFIVSSSCSRCTMINVNPITLETNNLILKTLASYRRHKARVMFGQYLTRIAGTSDSLEWIHVNDLVLIKKIKIEKP